MGLFKIFGWVFALSVVVSCSNSQRSFDEIQKSGVLRIISTNSELTYYENRDGTASGFDYEMAKAFAENLGLKAEFVIEDSVGDALRALEYGDGDLVAAGISITEKREGRISFTSSFLETQQKVVCQDSVRPKNLNELQKYEIAVGASTSYLERLATLREQYEGLSWIEVSGETTPELIRAVADEKYECTIADEHIVRIYRRYFPKLQVTMDLGSPEEIAWAIHPDSKKLLNRANGWIERVKDTKIKSWKENHFGFVQEFDFFDIKKFIERINTRLPKYKALLKKAAKEYGWSWTLLAAISYQESHWDPTSRSQTGVRGFMMLTQTTAKAMGVKNRVDPAESITGGAKYLRRLEKRIPGYISNPDRKWMTLAAYNVGFAHLRDARGVAAWKNENPNRWSGVRKVLPLLASRKVYKRLPHGYARGLEPVLYVDRIRNYHRILKRKLSGR